MPRDICQRIPYSIYETSYMICEIDDRHRVQVLLYVSLYVSLYVCRRVSAARRDVAGGEG